MDQAIEKDTEVLKLESDFSLVEYDDELIDRDGNKVNINNDKENQEEEEENGGENVQLREILNSLLPPICVDNGNDYYRQVSINKANRENVILLQKLWDQQLQIRQARESGICAIREELNEQAFNELIREITINLAERGLLMLRIRDESKMTISTYQTLYQSSLSFGMRKTIQSQNQIKNLNQKINILKEKKKNLNKKLKQLQIEKQNYEKLYNDKTQIAQKHRNQEIEFLKHQQQALQGFIKTEFGK